MKNSEVIIKQTFGLVVFSLGIIILFNAIRVQIPRANSQETASLILNFDNGTKRMFEGPVAEGMTVLEALQSSARNGGFKFAYNYERLGVIQLESIADKPNRVRDRFWRFYLNGQAINTENIGNIIIKKQDRIEARYE